MKGKHYVSVVKNNNWYTVYVGSEVINAKEPVAKFIDLGEAEGWAYDHAQYLSIGVKK